MSWNYRVTKETINGQDWYAIKEVYYRKGTKAKIPTEKDVDGWSADAMAISGETLEDIRWDLEHMQRAYSQPVIDLDTLREEHDND